MADTATKASVLKHYDELAGRKNYFELREVETVDQGKVTQVISAGGSLVAQVNATGQDALDRLARGTGAEVIDTGENPKDSVEDNKHYVSKQGTPAFPTQPEALEGSRAVEEIDHTDKEGRVLNDNQRSTGEASEVDTKEDTSTRTDTETEDDK